MLLSRKVNKNNDGSDMYGLYGYDADESGLDLYLLPVWPRDDAAFRQDISTAYNILIEFIQSH